jgi:hypothetical protein
VKFTSRLVLGPAIAAILVALLSIVPSNSAAAEATPPSSGTCKRVDADEPLLVHCSIEANSYTDFLNGETNILALWVDDKPQHITRIEGARYIESSSAGGVDAQFYLNSYYDAMTDTTSDMVSMNLGKDVTDAFEFWASLTNGFSIHVVVYPIAYELPLAPIVTKTDKRGYIEACEPKESSSSVVIQIGKINAGYMYDTYAEVQPGTCPEIAVFRRNIEWVAYDSRNGTFVDSGVVKNIKLPKRIKMPAPKPIKKLLATMRTGAL